MRELSFKEYIIKHTDFFSDTLFDHVYGWSVIVFTTITTAGLSLLTLYVEYLTSPERLL